MNIPRPISKLISRATCKCKGHMYWPITTYMLEDLGNLHFKGKIKLYCKRCSRAVISNAEFQYSEERQQLLMGWDLPKD